jgi:predicted nuclease of predicted toxin-antitoxin system
VKLLIDEMWPAAIAAQMRRRGHDAVAVHERSDLRGQPDEIVFAMAQAEGRVVVTENVIDYRPLATDVLQRGGSHVGVIFTSNHRFPRHDPRTVGRLVTALDQLLTNAVESTSMEHWLS